MRRTLAVLALALAAQLLAGPAAGKNMHGKFGTGYQQTLLSTRGLQFTYWASPQLAVQLLMGAGFVLNEDNDSTTTILASTGFKYVLYGTKFANLSIGGRLDIGWASRILTPQYGKSTDCLAAEAKDELETQCDESSNVTQLGLEIPIEVEYFLSDAFSFNLATGATFTVVPEGPDRDTLLLQTGGLGNPGHAEYKGIGIGVGSLFGHAGFTLYF